MFCPALCVLPSILVITANVQDLLVEQVSLSENFEVNFERRELLLLYKIVFDPKGSNEFVLRIEKNKFRLGKRLMSFNEIWTDCNQGVPLKKPS